MDLGPVSFFIFGCLLDFLFFSKMYVYIFAHLWVVCILAICGFCTWKKNSKKRKDGVRYVLSVSFTYICIYTMKCSPVYVTYTRCLDYKLYFVHACEKHTWIYIIKKHGYVEIVVFFSNTAGVAYFDLRNFWKNSAQMFS